jgi:hypothetical protein
LRKDSSTLSSLWVIDGSIYAADEEVYIRIKDTITDAIEVIPDTEFNETNEIGRLNEVDPLKLAHLRIRGMWLLKPPIVAFEGYHNYSSDHTFQYHCILPLTKYNSYTESSREAIEGINEISISDVSVVPSRFATKCPHCTADLT